MLVLVVVLAIVVVVAAAAVISVSGATGGLRIGGRNRGPTRRGPGAGRVQRGGTRRRSTDERVLLAEGEELQEQVEARLRAQGVAAHRLSGPNPPIAADRLAPQPVTDPLTDPLYAPVASPSGAPLYRTPETSLPGNGLPPDAYAEHDPIDSSIDPNYRDRRSAGGALGRRRRRGRIDGPGAPRRLRD